MSTADNNTVRRLIYGGSTKSGSLSTADIAWFVAANGNVYLAAAAAAVAEGAAAGGAGRKKVGDLEIDESSGGWESLAKSLRLQGIRRVTPYSGGISQSDKAAQESDGDRVAPAFRVGQFDYEPSDTVTST